MKKTILLKDIIDILPEVVDIYYKGSYVSDFNKDELKQSQWINDKILLIQGCDDQETGVYLTDINRGF